MPNLMRDIFASYIKFKKTSAGFLVEMLVKISTRVKFVKHFLKNLRYTLSLSSFCMARRIFADSLAFSLISLTFSAFPDRQTP